MASLSPSPASTSPKLRPCASASCSTSGPTTPRPSSRPCATASARRPRRGARIVFLPELTLSRYPADTLPEGTPSRHRRGPRRPARRHLRPCRGHATSASTCTPRCTSAPTGATGSGFNTAVARRPRAASSWPAPARPTSRSPPATTRTSTSARARRDDAVPGVAPDDPAGARLGLPTCWDEWFPEVARALLARRRRGARATRPRSAPSRTTPTSTPSRCGSRSSSATASPTACSWSCPTAPAPRAHHLLRLVVHLRPLRPHPRRRRRATRRPSSSPTSTSRSAATGSTLFPFLATRRPDSYAALTAPGARRAPSRGRTVTEPPCRASGRSAGLAHAVGDRAATSCTWMAWPSRGLHARRHPRRGRRRPAARGRPSPTPSCEFEPVTHGRRPRRRRGRPRATCTPDVERRRRPPRRRLDARHRADLRRRADGARSARSTGSSTAGARRRGRPGTTTRCIGAFVGGRAGAEVIGSPLVNEGGGIHVDGLGTVLLTETVQLDPGRNPGLTRADVEAELARTIGATTCIWLPRGPDPRLRRVRHPRPRRHRGDHRRARASCCCTSSATPAHPDHAVSRELERAAVDDAATRAASRFEVVELPAPETLARRRGLRSTGRYVNHLVVNGGVIACTFDDPQDDDALAHPRATPTPAAASSVSTRGRSSPAAAASTASPSSSRPLAVESSSGRRRAPRTSCSFDRRTGVAGQAWGSRLWMSSLIRTTER